MSLFPLVQDPCPYKGPIEDILVGSQCRLCQREVFDLTGMSASERRELVSGCSNSEGLCVRYRVRAGSAVAAAMLGAAGLASPAMAQGTTPVEADAPAEPAQRTQAEDPEDWDWGNVIIVGGIRHIDKAEWKSGKAPERKRKLPVITEQGEPTT